MSLSLRWGKFRLKSGLSSPPPLFYIFLSYNDKAVWYVPVHHSPTSFYSCRQRHWERHQYSPTEFSQRLQSYLPKKSHKESHQRIKVDNRISPANFDVKDKFKFYHCYLFTSEPFSNKLESDCFGLHL